MATCTVGRNLPVWSLKGLLPWHFEFFVERMQQLEIFTSSFFFNALCIWRFVVKEIVNNLGLLKIADQKYLLMFVICNGKTVYSEPCNACKL